MNSEKAMKPSRLADEGPSKALVRASRGTGRSGRVLA